MEKENLFDQTRKAENVQLANFLPVSLITSHRKLIEAAELINGTPEEKLMVLEYYFFMHFGYPEKVAEVFERPVDETRKNLDLVRDSEPLQEKLDGLLGISSNRNSHAFYKRY